MCVAIAIAIAIDLFYIVKNIRSDPIHRDCVTLVHIVHIVHIEGNIATPEAAEAAEVVYDCWCG